MASIPRGTCSRTNSVANMIAPMTMTPNEEPADHSLQVGMATALSQAL